MPDGGIWWRSGLWEHCCDGRFGRPRRLRARDSRPAARRQGARVLYSGVVRIAARRCLTLTRGRSAPISVLTPGGRKPKMEDFEADLDTLRVRRAAVALQEIVRRLFKLFNGLRLHETREFV